MLLLIEQIRVVKPQEWNQIQETFVTISATAQAYVAQSLAHPESRSSYSSALDCLLESYGGADGIVLFNLVRDPASPLQLALINACLELWLTIGQSVAETPLAPVCTYQATSRILAAVKECAASASSLPQGNAVKAALQQLVRQRLLGFAASTEKFSRQDMAHKFVRSDLAGLAMSSASSGDYDTCQATVSACLDLAAQCVDEPTSGATDAGGYIHSAVLISALDKTGRSTATLIQRLHSGLWKSFAKRWAGSVPIMLKLLQPADENEFLGDSPAADLYRLSTNQRKNLLELTNFQHLLSVQQRVAAALQDDQPAPPASDAPG